MISKPKRSSANKRPSSQNSLSALSVRQPFAELILRGLKKIEYRSVVTHKRERVYIYASKVPVDDPGSWAKVKLEPGDLPTGVLVGTVEIVGCVGVPGITTGSWRVPSAWRSHSNPSECLSRFSLRPFDGTSRMTTMLFTWGY
jgi:hypothetical protein